MEFHLPDAIDFIFNQVLLLILVMTLFTTSLVFRRMTALGRSLSWFDFAFAIAYFCAVLSIWVPFFQSELWRFVIRLILIFVAFRVVWQLQISFGGWIPLYNEVRLSLLEFYWEIDSYISKPSLWLRDRILKR